MAAANDKERPLTHAVLRTVLPTLAQVGLSVAGAPAAVTRVAAPLVVGGLSSLDAPEGERSLRALLGAAGAMAGSEAALAVHPQLEKRLGPRVDRILRRPSKATLGDRATVVLTDPILMPALLSSLGTRAGIAASRRLAERLSDRKGEE